MDHAAAFVKQHFPLLLVHLPHSTDEVPDGKFDAYIHYARPRDDADARSSNGSNWICPACDFSNYASRNKCKQGLNGDADASDVPSQILVIHPLPPFVNEDMLAGDIKRLELERPDPSKDTSRGAPKLKSTAPTGDASRFGARPGSLHRVFLMRSPKTEESVKYGFAEFWTIEDAVAAVAKFRMSRSFTVAACAVSVSHIHMGVFIPEERDVEPAIERLSFNPLFNPALRVKYRDPRAYPSQKIVTSEPPVGDGTSPKNQDDELNDAKKSKKRKADGSLGAAAKKSVNMAGHMALWQRKHDEIHAEAALSKKGHSASAPGDGNQGSVVTGSTLKGDPKAPIRISLSGSTLASAAPRIEASVAAAKDEPSTGPVQAQSGDEGAAAPVSYVDRERLMCLICMRKYKSTDEVNIHEKSRNHKTATENDELVKAALPRLAARDKRLQKQAGGEGESAGDAGTAPQYRDRAKERREAYNQPDKPKPASSAHGDKSKPEHAKALQPKKDEAKLSSASASASVSASASATAAAPAPTQSKGAGMLAKMGWTGSGLGANGEGRTDVIVTHAYQEGVGLGAEGGNLGDASDLADKKTRNSYAEYLTTVQDKARERYSRMS
ncbi:putative RNA-binding protein [Escovopsis weberi]|uniref:Putative RNA-binding protein n=1 Tax=Escovopsis weberi TaxID=150374 RepID=A0A0M9VVD7_ESCWE|nr:putative RNA-binding protein [Escovopsis weberi]